MKTMLLGFLFCLTGVSLSAIAGSPAFADSFGTDKAHLVSTGRNRFFVLEPGYQLVLEGKEKGKATVLTITVLNETKLVDGVETRVEERESGNGQVVEISRNYFAISTKTSDVLLWRGRGQLQGRQGH